VLYIEHPLPHALDLCQRLGPSRPLGDNALETSHFLADQRAHRGPFFSSRRLREQNVRYPYLLRGLSIDRVNHVWSTDITYIRLQRGFLYLVAIIDWFSRYVLAWRTSITLETAFCLEALEQALERARPEIFNNDQGSQFTSTDFTNRLKAADVRISWYSRGRALDNIFVERLWRSVKYEEVYRKRVSVRL